MEQQEFILNIEAKLNYLYVRASGKRSNETIKAITIKVFNTAIEMHLSTILIDVRELIGSFGYMEILLFVGQELEALRGKGVNQVAIIDIKRSSIQGFFLENVAQNHGFNFRAFEKESAALKWLGI